MSQIRMKYKSFAVAAFLLVSIFVAKEVVYGWGASSGDGGRYTQLQETAVFFNNSGGVLSAGDVVILDTTGTGVSSGTTLGGYVTSTTSADSTLVVGIVKSVSSADQTPVVVVTKGPTPANCQNAAGTNVIAGTAVGSYTTARTCDSGTNLGIAIAPGAGLNYLSTGNQSWVWVDPTGAD